jgi:MYXO-CTERM domain-containing protein
VPVADRDGARSYWYYALPAAALALLGLAVVRRRRRNGTSEPVVETAPVAAAPPTPRPDPIPRPWLELSLKAERASFTATEAVVQFELEISNTGGSAARNLRIDVKMFNAGVEQDREIGAFFKTAGRESTKLSLPIVEAGVTGVIKGQVKMAVDEMRAVRLDERLLFIPVIAVNALYDRGADRTGQTSRSYVVGRELQDASEKMGAFRVDQGPRVWRTVGQRAHKLAKRV